MHDDDKPLIFHMPYLDGNMQGLLKAEQCLVVPVHNGHRITCPPRTTRRAIGFIVERGHVKVIPNYIGLEFPSHRKMILRLNRVGHNEFFTIVDRELHFDDVK